MLGLVARKGWFRSPLGRQPLALLDFLPGDGLLFPRRALGASSAMLYLSLMERSGNE
jgi:hypothetical protein